MAISLAMACISLSKMKQFANSFMLTLINFIPQNQLCNYERNKLLVEEKSFSSTA